MVIAVDLDRTLCEQVWPEPFERAVPIKENIERINKLYDAGHEILIYTARMIDDRKETIIWLTYHNVKFHHVQFCKLRADLYVDCDAVRPEELDDMEESLREEV
jgi:hypothetical protein